MPEAQTVPPRRRRAWLTLAIPLLLLGSYQVVMMSVRSCSNARIQGSIGQELPAFSLRDRDGATWTAAGLRGRQVVLHFFRSLCHSCDVEAPEQRRLEDELDPAAVQVLHVMTDQVLEFEPAVTAATLLAKGFRRPVLLADRAFVDAFHSVTFAQVTPVTYLVDANGRIQHALRGAQSADEVRRLLANMR